MKLEWLATKKLQRTERRVDGFSFFVCDGTLLLAECCWRLCGPDGLIVTSDDDGERSFSIDDRNGNESIVEFRRDVTAELAIELQDASIDSANVRIPSNDLILRFDSGKTLEFIQTRLNAGGWCLQSNHINVVALPHRLSVRSKQDNADEPCSAR